ncbi:MAG: FAD-dependent oxidoreductase [Thermoleophilaceae bacterium]
MAQRVIVLGGGVAGMTAAHELAERGFEVTVYETRPDPGGKARSMPTEPPVAGQPRPLPGEHGFRFFPGFYRHVPDTMKRIPFGDNKNGVFDNLVRSEQVEIARQGQSEMIAPAHFPDDVDELGEAFGFFFEYATQLGISLDDQIHFVNRLLLFLTSCDKRRVDEWEKQSWWEYSGASTRGAGYQKFLADGLTRSLVAAQAKEMSARTGASILIQLLFDMAQPGGQVDRVLCGPTSDVWIGPWFDLLEQLGVDYRLECQVQSIEMDRGRVTGVKIVNHGKPFDDSADWYVSAVPVEVMDLLASPEMRLADPGLAALSRLRTRWMNGIMFYLDRDVPLVRGHTIYIDSAWALTSISQAQFWRNVDIEKFGDGKVNGILSVDISDWYTPGTEKVKKQAMYCSREQVAEEVWAQLKASLDVEGQQLLEDANVVSWFLDPAITYPNPIEAMNLEPLLINTAGSWPDRPQAATKIENLFLASDYVQTYTDLATMEGANEAARRAVNGILDASGSSEKRCRLWKLHEPELFEPFKALDRMLFELHLPPVELVGLDAGGMLRLHHVVNAMSDVEHFGEGVARRLLGLVGL